jgi:hypothetical protein
MVLTVKDDDSFPCRMANISRSLRARQKLASITVEQFERRLEQKNPMGD